MTLSPLKRIQVNDGMLITADHWQIAHSYHQQRQTIHYGALHHGGVVGGLGVSICPIPDEAPSRYRQPRWLTIQPGLAIDSKGNPIVVAQAESCYLSAQPTTETTIYIVLRHSEQAPSAKGEIIQEAFQILEKDQPATPEEVELCRVRLAPDDSAIIAPPAPLSPAINQLDLRYRQAPRLRASLTATVSAWATTAGRAPEVEQFQSLLRAIPSLYPSLAGEWIERRTDSDLSYLSHAAFAQLDRTGQQIAATYLKKGGVLLVTARSESLGNLLQVERELSTATRQPLPDALKGSTDDELAEVRRCIQQGVSQLSAPIQQFANHYELVNPPSQTAAIAAPQPILRLTEPFVFSQLPTVQARPIALYGWGGLLLLIGDLPAAWSAHSALSLSREEIRAAQEFGINLLHFAARRHQIHRWLTPEISVQEEG